MKKTCSKCKKEKPIEEFVKSVYTKDGYKCNCRICYRESSNEYYRLNKAKMDEASRRWKIENKDYVSERRKARYKKVDTPSKGRPKGRTKEKAQQHTDQYLKKYYIKNKENYAKRAKLTNQRINETRRERIAKNPSTKIGYNYTSKVSSFVKRGNRSSSLSLLGCSHQELRLWLENHFQEGMSWNNYGKGDEKWHIDHHFPCSSFDLTLQDHQQACFHYTNLYPMWAKENISKSAKILPPRENLYSHPALAPMLV